jgi:hypothetical protein
MAERVSADFHRADMRPQFAIAPVVRTIREEPADEESAGYVPIQIQADESIETMCA